MTICNAMSGTQYSDSVQYLTLSETTTNVSYVKGRKILA